MPPHAVHDAEVHRQHVRLQVPVQVEVDDVRYQVDNWSMGGFGVDSVMISRRSRERFPVRLIFPFEEFEMSMRLEVRMVYADQDHGRFGCAFVGLSREQVAVLRYLTGAYLSGEVVTAGDLLRIRPREGAGEVRPVRTPEPAPGGSARAGWLRRALGPASLGVVAGALALVAAQALGQLPLGSPALTGVVEGAVTLVRAPAAGRFTPSLPAGARAGPGTTLGQIETAAGASLPLESPCPCTVLDVPASNGATYRAGDSLVALIDIDRPLTIRVGVPPDQTSGLERGTRVEIRSHSDHDSIDYGQVERIDRKPGLEALWQGATGLLLAAPQAQVVIRPDRPLRLEEFGTLVTIRLP